MWDYYPDAKRKARLQLMYRCRGIVSHDRMLNGEQP